MSKRFSRLSDPHHLALNDKAPASLRFQAAFRRNPYYTRNLGDLNITFPKTLIV
jgi:hypothetical protein